MAVTAPSDDKREPTTHGKTPPSTMPRTSRTDQAEPATENVWRMTPEEIEAWHAEGRELQVSLREQIAAKAAPGERDEKAA